MTFKYKNYYLVPETMAYGRYNLYKEVTIRNGKNKGVKQKRVVNFGITAERAVFVIAEMEMAKDKSVKSLLEYGNELKKYKSEVLLK